MRESENGSERITAGLLFDTCRRLFANNEYFVGQGEHAGMLALSGTYTNIEPGINAVIGLYSVVYQENENGVTAPSYVVAVEIPGKAEFRLQVFEFGEATLGFGLEPSKSDPPEVFLKFGLQALESTVFDPVATKELLR